MTVVNTKCFDILAGEVFSDYSIIGNPRISLSVSSLPCPFSDLHQEALRGCNGAAKATK